MHSTPTGQVTEIVRFRLKDGADTARFVADARATLPFVERVSGMIARHLSVDADGLWSDTLIWATMAQAQAAQAAARQEPSFGPFMSHIDLDSVDMSHDTLHWSATGTG